MPREAEGKAISPQPFISQIEDDDDETYQSEMTSSENLQPLASSDNSAKASVPCLPNSMVGIKFFYTILERLEKSRSQSFVENF